ncbi:hypothetical protein L596_018384 [Steinernema carpocapsae]|uniref:MADF domain-containing protein n=1 Tax=Steinernema carpocapsae TaxID=34508 RepID=A0A4U5N5H5_STECR|nr:hypothetical protein L596_018384 [Steinernema carpocapsae]
MEQYKWSQKQRFQLIHAVQAHPELWDDQHADRRNRQRIEAVWSEIFEESADYRGTFAVDDFRKQWKNLRDAFFKARKAFYADIEAKREPHFTSWIYFDRCTFLDPNFGMRYAQCKAKAGAFGSQRRKRSSSGPEPADRGSGSRSPKKQKTESEDEDIIEEIVVEGEEEEDRFTRFGFLLRETMEVMFEHQPKIVTNTVVEIYQTLVDGLYVVLQDKPEGEKAILLEMHRNVEELREKLKERMEEIRQIEL